MHGQHVNFSKWGLNKPNGRHFQQCIVTHNVYTKNYIFDDISCDLEACYTCSIPTRNSFQIRGHMPSNFDTEFLAILDKNSLKTRGNFRSELIWTNSSWCLEDAYCTPGVRQIPPFGLHSWMKQNKKGSKMDIKISQVSKYSKVNL